MGFYLGLPQQSLIFTFSDCPIWSNWNLEIDQCWRGEFWFDGRFEHQDPGCNKFDMYAEFRKCYMGGIKDCSKFVNYKRLS